MWRKINNRYCKEWMAETVFSIHCGFFKSLNWALAPLLTVYTPIKNLMSAFFFIHFLYIRSLVKATLQSNESRETERLIYKEFETLVMEWKQLYLLQINKWKTDSPLRAWILHRMDFAVFGAINFHSIHSWISFWLRM